MSCLAIVISNPQVHKVTWKSTALGVPKMSSVPISTREGGAWLIVTGTFQFSQEGPTLNLNCKSTQKIKQYSPSEFQVVAGLRWTDLELFSRTSTSFLAVASVVSHVPAAGIHMPPGALGLSRSGYAGFPGFWLSMPWRGPPSAHVSSILLIP